MKIALVCAPERGETDRLLTRAADRLQADGVRLAGIVKAPEHAIAVDNACDIDVLVLPAGPAIQITQSLGPGSSACRLDPGAIAAAVAEVERGDLDRADLFILNKFGPEEAAGRGFCNVIAAALEKDIPVLVGVGVKSREAFDDFAQGLAEELPASGDTIHDWCLSTMSRQSLREPV